MGRSRTGHSSGRLDGRWLISLLRTDACVPELAATQFGRSVILESMLSRLLLFAVVILGSTSVRAQSRTYDSADKRIRVIVIAVGQHGYERYESRVEIHTSDMNMAKHIEIVAVSAEGAALCYRTVCVEGAARLGSHAHPEVTLHTYSLADYMHHIDARQWHEVGEMLLSSAEKLRKAGADLLFCPDNAAHEALDIVRARSPLPWLHIAEEVAAAAAERGHKRLLVLGTRYLMEGPVYPAKLRPRGLEYEIPDTESREQINTLTFDELLYGRFDESTRAYFKDVIREAQGRGCDAVILGCTEFPLLISDADSPLPMLDSTRILARAALRAAVRQ